MDNFPSSKNTFHVKERRRVKRGISQRRGTYFGAISKEKVKQKRNAAIKHGVRQVNSTENSKIEKQYNPEINMFTAPPQRKTKLTQFHTMDWFHRHTRKYRKCIKTPKSQIPTRLLERLKTIFEMLPKSYNTVKRERRKGFSLRLLQQRFDKMGLKSPETKSLMTCLAQPRGKDEVSFDAFISSLVADANGEYQSLQHQRENSGALSQLLNVASMIERLNHIKTLNDSKKRTAVNEKSLSAFSDLFRGRENNEKKRTKRIQLSKHQNTDDTESLPMPVHSQRSDLRRRPELNMTLSDLEFWKNTKFGSQRSHVRFQN